MDKSRVKNFIVKELFTQNDNEIGKNKINLIRETNTHKNNKIKLMKKFQFVHEKKSSL